MTWCIGKDMRSTIHPPLDTSVSGGESYCNIISEAAHITLLSRDVPDFLIVNPYFSLHPSPTAVNSYFAVVGEKQRAGEVGCKDQWADIGLPNQLLVLFICS
jgi:hypothetical protein